jgi:hypothetical protein
MTVAYGRLWTLALWPGDAGVFALGNHRLQLSLIAEALPKVPG